MTLVRQLEYEYNLNLVDLVLERPESPLRSCTLAMLIEPMELYARDFQDLLLTRKKDRADGDPSRQCLEILLALSNAEISKFRDTYKQVFECLVEKEIQLVYGDDSILSNLFIQLLEGKRDEDAEYSVSFAKSVAKKLYEAGEGTPGIDYETFIRIFTGDPFAQLSAIFDIYEDKYGGPIQEAIEREFQRQSESVCFQDIVEYTRSPSGYYSKILRQALDKTPIDYRTLIRILIGHQEKDLGEIKLEYSKLYDQTLEQTIGQRLEIHEIKRLFILIVSNGHDITDNENGAVRFDHVNNSPSPNATASPTPTASNPGMRRNRSHDAFDKFVNVFKTMRPH